MLGGGNPVSSSNPSGTSGSLNYVGKHAYGYSGTIALDASGANTTMLEFETGNSYLVGQLNFTGVWSDLGSTALNMILLINGEEIFNNRVASVSVRDVEGTPYPVLIPPFSKIEVQMSQGSGSTRDYQAMLIGEVYA
jgi:hypothetical protein